VIEIMIRYKQFSQAGTASVLKKSTPLTGTKTEPKRITALRWVEVTATEENDAVISIYKNQNLICEFDIRLSFIVFDAAPCNFERKIPLDIQLNEGNELTVGHTSGGTASDMLYNLEYETKE